MNINISYAPEEVMVTKSLDVTFSLQAKVKLRPVCMCVCEDIDVAINVTNKW